MRTRPRWSRGIALAIAGPPAGSRASAQTGDITGTPGIPGIVVAAPHGTVDTNTAEIVEAVAKRTGFGSVVASVEHSVKSRGAGMIMVKLDQPKAALCHC